MERLFFWGRNGYPVEVSSRNPSPCYKLATLEDDGRTEVTRQWWATCQHTHDFRRVYARITLPWPESESLGWCGPRGVRIETYRVELAKEITWNVRISANRHTIELEEIPHDFLLEHRHFEWFDRIASRLIVADYQNGPDSIGRRRRRRAA